MLPLVPIPPRRVDELIEPAGADAIERLRDAASALHGARILQLNSTNFGGGVAELLFTHVALMNDLGVETDWRVINGHEDFFYVTKTVHNALQGAETVWTEHMEQTYFNQCLENAQEWTDDYDYVIVNDPQPVALLSILEGEGRRKGKWAWRCHIDLSNSYQPVWDYYAQWVSHYDSAVFTMQDFVRPGFHGPEVFIIPPSIDPLSTKNSWLGPGTVYEILARYGVDRSRPIMTQVSRFDPWKDPVGVIDAYRIVKQTVPDLQLVMIASMAQDDPEGLHYYEVTERHREGDPDVFLLSNLQGVGNSEVNAFQRAVHRHRAEVPPGGLRPGRLRGHVEGAGGGRGKHRGHPTADRGRRQRIPGRLRRGLRPAGDRTPRRLGAAGRAGPGGTGTGPGSVPDATRARGHAPHARCAVAPS